MSVDPAHLLAGIAIDNAVPTEGSNGVSMFGGSEEISYPQYMSFSGRSASSISQVSPSISTPDFSLAQANSIPLYHAKGNLSMNQNIHQDAARLSTDVSRGKSSRVSPVSTSRTRAPAQNTKDNRNPVPQIPLSNGPQTKSEQQREALEKLSKSITQEIQSSSSTTASTDLEQLVLRVLCAQQQQDKGGVKASKSSSSQPQTSDAPQNAQKCPFEHCQFTGRNCDLNKHVKRHLKPYGCTYPKCHKRFGAKSDWKRHENSQHFQQEAWRCEYSNIEGKKCGEHCYRMAKFQEHLEKVHAINAIDQVQQDLKRCKIGKNCQIQFWCGFCGSIQKLEQRRNDAWDERFDHIARHFEKDNRCIDDWVCVEENKTKEQVRKGVDRGAFPDDESTSSNEDRGGDIVITGGIELMAAMPGVGPNPSAMQKAPRKRSAPKEALDSHRVLQRKKPVTKVIYCVSRHAYIY